MKPQSALEKEWERAAKYVAIRLEKLEKAEGLPSLLTDPRTGELIDVLIYTQRARGRIDQAKRAVEANEKAAAQYHHGQARRLACRIYGIAKALGYLPTD